MHRGGETDPCMDRHKHIEVYIENVMSRKMSI